MTDKLKNIGFYGKTGLICAALVLSLIFCSSAMVRAAGKPLSFCPTPQKPLLLDKKGRRILLYTEISLKHLSETNPHWGVVSMQGKLVNKAIFRAYASPSDFFDALVDIGARPGNNLNLVSSGDKVAGDRLAVSAIWPGLDKELPLSAIVSDATGRGFDIRFGGNRERAVKEKTGCILCLESCPISITSNAAYPTIGPVKRLFSPNSQFKGRSDVLPNVDRHPVIFIFRMSDPVLK